MHIQRIPGEIYIIEDFLGEAQIENIFRCISLVGSLKPKVSDVYSCEVIKLKEGDNYFSNIVQYIYEKDITPLIEKLYNKKLRIGDLLEVIRIKKGDFLSEHIDNYNGVQGVFYLSTLKGNEGGILEINGNSIPPKKGTALFFLGDMKHSVSKFLGESERYSISLGFKEI